jgi:hypothetical protein
MIIRWVKARGWPWSAELSLCDDSGRVLAHHAASVEALRQPRQARIQSALTELQDEQTLLQLHYSTNDDVRLAHDRSDEEQLAELVGRYDIDPQLMDFDQWPRLREQLRSLSPLKLWELVADWYDEYQTGTRAGTSRKNPPQWLVHAHPDSASYWGWLAGQVQAASPWQLFADHHQTLTLPVTTMYDLLHYELAMRTEFTGRDDVGFTQLGI